MGKNLQSLTLASTLMAASCSTAVQHAAVDNVNKRTEREYDCSSLDLTKKPGFKTSFMVGENRFCYNVSLSRGELSEAIFDCDDRGNPLAGHSIAIRGLSGQYKGYMKMNVVVEVFGDSITYVPFLRSPHGKIIYDNGVAELGNLEQLFKNGKRMLELSKNRPDVCKELLEYQPEVL